MLFGTVINGNLKKIELPVAYIGELIFCIDESSTLLNSLISFGSFVDSLRFSV